ncbi:MAG: hypothetical protein ACOC41_00025 [Chitinivibrionales bacterium]
MTGIRTLISVFTMLTILTNAGKAYSLNTIETFDQYNDYFSIELGLQELGPGSLGPKTTGTAILGRGLNSFISGYMGVIVQGNRYFSGGSGGFFMGSIAGIYKHLPFSLDVTVEVGLYDYYFYASPGVEVNFDLAPDQQFMGFYLSAAEQLTGRDTAWAEDDTTTPHDESSPKHVFAPETELKLGFYYSFIAGQQLHLRFDQRFRNNPLGNERGYEIDALRLGYNMMVFNGLQIQTEFNYRFPQYENKSRFGFKIGLAKW